MEKKIICIGRQYGSGGREVGEKLAEQPDILCYDKLLIKQAALESGLSESIVAGDDEKPVGLACMVSGNPFADSVSMGEAFYSERQNVFEAERKAIWDIVAKGLCVIIGRCASAILREAGFDTTSVFVYADKDDRVQRIVARNGGDVKAAARKMQKLDRMRKHYFDFYAGTAWGEPESYDLMLSTSRYGIDGVADIIKNIVTKGK